MIGLGTRLGVGILMLLAAGCSKKDGAEAAEAAPASATAEAPPAAAPQEPVGRRGRQGIDLSSVQTRPIDGRAPAAQVIPRAPDVAVPPRKTGAEVESADGAVAFVRGPWSTAVQGSEPEAYGALLAKDFRGLQSRVGAAPETFDSASWSAKRRPVLGTATTIGPVEVHLMPGPEGRVTLRFPERAGEGASCVESSRELTLRPRAGDDRAYEIVAVHALDQAACAPPDAAGLAAAHEALRSAWRDKDVTGARELAGRGGWVRDRGLDVVRYDGATLLSGAGRWLLDAAKAVEASPDATHSLGRTGWIDAGDAGTFVYARRRDGWSLEGILR